LTANINGAAMLPLSVLNDVRKEIVSRLNAMGMQRPQREPASTLAELRVASRLTREGEAPAEPIQRGVHDTQRLGRSLALSTEKSSATLRVLCRNLDQLRELLAYDVRDVYVDFQDIREYREAVAIARDHQVCIFLATPRIQKPDEFNLFKALAKHDPDGLLVRNLAGLQFCVDQGIAAVADFSLNATNELTFDWMCQRGAQRVTASYDMNRQQMLDMVAAVSPADLEVVVHQHMPMFHMEHCVFCAVLSPGTNKTNCGRPCDVHLVELRDHIGMEHRLTADVGCRNTLYNAVPQSAAEAVPALLEHGVRNFRIELLDERGDQLRSILSLYRDLLAGNVHGREVWTQLNAMNRVGVTRGTLETRRDPLAIL
jgi:putative protease